MTPEDKRIIATPEFSQAYNKHNGKWPDSLKAAHLAESEASND